MSPIIVAACYGSAAILSLAILWHFGAQRWYWHTLSTIVALGLGLAPMPEPLGQPVYTLVIGWVFTALFLWGVIAPVVAAIQHAPGMHVKHH